MTPRERVRCALNHEKPDRTPMDLGGGVSTLTYGAYARLIEHLGIRQPQGQVGEFKVMVGIDELILERLGVDFRSIFLNARDGWQPRVHPDGTCEDEWGIRFRDVGDYTEMVGHPLPDPRALRAHLRGGCRGENRNLFHHGSAGGCRGRDPDDLLRHARADRHE